MRLCHSIHASLVNGVLFYLFCFFGRQHRGGDGGEGSVGEEGFGGILSVWRILGCLEDPRGFGKMLGGLDDSRGFEGCWGDWRIPEDWSNYGGIGGNSGTLDVPGRCWVNHGVI